MDAVDMAGRTVGRWTVLRRSDIQHAHGMLYWLCRCSCGTLRNVSGSSLRAGLSSGCSSCAAANRRIRPASP